VALPLAVDVLMHHREQWRPSSTGHLVQRTVAGARQHVWRRERHMQADEVRRAGRELWILHPHGAPMPPETRAENVQVLLIDGAWKEATMMAREVSSWGRLVSLPMSGESRYWLRTQQSGGRFSTFEALLFVIEAFGLKAEHAALRVQFELHVYAGLRARGAKEEALAFLKESPLRNALPDVLAQLDVRRPRVAE
jgi:DTW domain-containing protein YfiP